MLSLRSPWAGPLLRLINAACLFPQGPSRELPRHRAAACVTVQLHQLHRLRLRVRVYASDCQLLYTVVVCYGEDKINSSETKDGERLIIELVITSHSHEFTQIMQIKSYHACKNFTLFSIYTRSTVFWSLSVTRTW